MSPTRPARGTALLAVALLLSLALVGCGGDDGGREATSGLPAVEDRPVLAYRIVYRVTTPDSTSTEELLVRRPFDARVIQRNGRGEVTGERWSTLGAIATRAPGDEARSIAAAATPALGDTRFDRVAAAMVAAGKLTQGEAATVRGRACSWVSEQTTAATLPSGADPNLTDAEPIRATVDRCVDVHGIVLEERWSSPGGQRLLTKRAAELGVGDDLELDLELPDAEPLSQAEGNGSFEPVDADTPSPGSEQFELAAPDDLDFVGRFEVAPPRLGNPSVGAAQLALVTDVWTRGPDVVLLDQGVGAGGATPFDDRTTWRPLELPALGPAELAGDSRMAEVRVRRPDGGFLRLAGTVPVEELEALASRIAPAG